MSLKEDTAKARIKLFLISYEFITSTFSGNGILARSLVLSLLQHGCQVTVWCCRPPPGEQKASDKTSNNGKDHPIQVPEVSQEEFDRLRILYTTISSRAKWHRLDDESAWAEFVWASLSGPMAEKAVKEASAVLVIDWTGHHAWKSTPFHHINKTATSKLLVYLNFRVFSSGVKDPPKRLWYDEKERLAVQQADLVVALSKKDKTSLLAMTIEHQDKVHILVPPLRGDVEDLAIQHAESDQPMSLFWNHMPKEAIKALVDTNVTTPRKCFVTCVVRLSPEKNTRRFVRFLEATQDFLQERNLIPLLAGSASDPAYAKLVKTEVRKFCGDNCVVLDSFLPPESLAAVFSCAVVNFHPCAYDAYGMTIMEAAAMGVPSIIEAGDTVGASVHVGGGASIPVDMKGDSEAYNHDHDHLEEDAIHKILEQLQDTSELERLGIESRKRALAWDEAAYGNALLQLIRALSPSHEARLKGPESTG